METGLSKTLSYFLRHAPEEGGVKLDSQGFAPLEQVLEAIQSRGWEEMTVEELRRKLADPRVKRFEVQGEAARACYGHSIDVKLDYPEISPDYPLFHGTSPKAAASIRREGLKPMGRDYVHLSRTRQEALRVGRRHHSEPILLKISPAVSEEISLYRAGPVVLAKNIPPRYLNEIE